MGFFSRPKDPLDRPMFHWSKRDFFSARDLLQSCCIFGASGSGKSSGSGLLFARAVFSLPNSGGFIAISKPEDKDFWIQRAKEAGRLDDLIIFGEHEAARCNFIDFEMQSGGDARTLTQFLLVTGESLSKGGAGNEKFWELSKARILYNAIEPCRLAWGKITIPELQSFISTASYSSSQLSAETPKEGGKSPLEKFKEGFHYKTMLAASKKTKTAIETGDYALATDYWVNEFTNMDNKVRSSVLADVMNVLHTYNVGIVREMVSTMTNASPADMARGKWLLWNFPIDEYGDSGKLMMHGGKLSAQRFILRRKAKPGDSVIVLWCDEAQDMVSSFDGSFLAKSRSHKGCMIYLTQSLHSYFGEAHGQAGEHKAKALLTNFGTKIFHTVGDGDTAAFASSLLGRRRETFVSFSPQPRQSFGDDIFNTGHGGGSFSESYQDVIQPVEFLTGLRQGGEYNNCMVDGIAIRSGKPFSSGENYMRVAFSQK